MPRQYTTPETSKYKELFSNQLRGIIAQNGISPCDVAKKLGVAPQTVYDWLNQKYLPSAYSISQICVFYGIDANRLLGVKRHG